MKLVQMHIFKFKHRVSVFNLVFIVFSFLLISRFFMHNFDCKVLVQSELRRIRKYFNFNHKI